MSVDDETWKRLMDSTQGHKVARAIYESLWKRSQEFGFTAPGDMISWENQLPEYKKCLIAVASDLFDNGVIDGGEALSSLYEQTRNSGLKPEG